MVDFKRLYDLCQGKDRATNWTLQDATVNGKKIGYAITVPFLVPSFNLELIMLIIFRVLGLVKFQESCQVEWREQLLTR